MKVALINGSPKPGSSVSGVNLQAMRERLGDEHEYVVGSAISLDVAQLEGCQAILFAFPLYVDGIPSRLLRLLCEMVADISRIAPDVMVWAIVNNGFFEGHQNALALDMVKSFCACAGVGWGQGIGVGAGGMAMAAPIGSGPMKSLGLALDSLADNMLQARAAADRFVTPNFPRALYRLGGTFGWRRQAKQNGLKAKDILAKRV